MRGGGEAGRLAGSAACSMWNPGNLKEAAKAGGMIPCVAEAMLVDCR